SIVCRNGVEFKDFMFIPFLNILLNKVSASLVTTIFRDTACRREKKQYDCLSLNRVSTKGT
ncbi:MAG: hypothetical protein M1305_07970, partial [Candidatus Marsarchaeota archaeon]|nr:hypothetical protein [Candidatus Marsarchaeota archaeon]